MKISNGEILASQMKQSILKYASTHNYSALKDDLWATQIAHRMVCVMAHHRRLRRSSEKVRQCLANATGAERQIIKELLALEPGKACKKAEKSNVKTADIAQENETHAGSSTDKPPKSDKKAGKLRREISDVSLDSEGFPMMLKFPDSDANACKKVEEASGKRSLKREPSSVSVDSDGFPRMLQSPEQKADKGSPRILEKRRGGLQRAKLAARDLANDSPKKKRKKQKTQEKDTVHMKRPAAKKAPKKRPSGQMEADTGEDGSERRPWQRVRKVLASKQSYLQGWDGQVWKLIVACSENMGSKFPEGNQGVIKKVEESAMDENMTKTKMLKKRQELLEA